MTNNGDAETLNDALCDIARTACGGVHFETIPDAGDDMPHLVHAVECPYCGEVTLPRDGGECIECKRESGRYSGRGIVAHPLHPYKGPPGLIGRRRL